MSGTCTLRIATPADADVVSEVLGNAYPALMAASYDPQTLALILPAMTRANPALLASRSFYVQETAGREIVSCGGWTRAAPGTGGIEPGVAHLRHFGTRVDWTGRGLGKAIFERCERDALAGGVRTFRCFSSLNAEPFYLALGFASVGRIDVDMRNGATCPTVVMTRALTRRPA